MLEFQVAGPFEVPVRKHGKSNVKIIEIESLKSFWEENEYENSRGVYVYAKRAAKGFVPLYIGKTTKCFKQEVFNPKNQLMINNLFHEGGKFKLVLFLIHHPEGKKVYEEKIDELETTLIQYGLKANINLLNDRKTKIADSWGIYGLLRCGHATKSSKALKRCLNI